MDKNKKILIVILLFAAFLRFWKINEVPVSLFGDELDVGYQAYSILKTGKDYSGNFWPLHFHSLAEWRTPLYLYSSVPTVAIFGISPLGVRLPAMIFGVLGVWAMYLAVKEILSYGVEYQKNHPRALLAAFLLTISPWHIQYSRAAFEVTMLLAFLLFGLYFFFKSLRKDSGKYLWIAIAFFVLTPWIYSTAKLFMPLFMLVLLVLFRKEIIRIPKKDLLKTCLVGLILGIPIAYSTIFGGGAQRFNYLSVFTDPTMEGDVGFARLNDAKMVQKYGGGIIEKAMARAVHNKYTFWGEKVIDNMFAPFSSDFLFNKGDINLRHSVEGVGQLYKADAIGLLLGIGLFFFLHKNKRIIAVMALWILLGVIPASITRDGGTHATRLILILPPLIFLISYGLVVFYKVLAGRWKYIFALTVFVLMSINFTFYQHNYWVHNPWYSERWWHSGFKETFEAMREVQDKYDKIIISNANEPPLIFFLAWNQYPPEIYQKGLQDEYIAGFETLKHTGKYYFGQVGKEGFYALPRILDDKTLYIAVHREVGTNLIMEPNKVPAGLHLIKAIAYPSGEPAYYLFERSEK